MRMAAAALVVCLLAYQSPGLLPKGTIGGIVVNASGAPMPGVAIELRRDRRTIQTTTTDTRGEWRFEKLSPARYEIRARRAGYDDVTLSVVLVDTRLQPLRIALRLSATQARQLESPRPAGSPNAAPVAAAVPGGVVGGVVGGLPGAPPPPPPYGVAGARKQVEPWNTEAYDRIHENPFLRVADDPLSTFSIDVDTASYANVRRFLNGGTLPTQDAVRIEELVNYFKYSYPQPSGGVPFSVTTEVSECPWNKRHRLALIGLRAPSLDAGRTPPRNLVFLLDVSGSMEPPDKLPLVRTAMRMLADTLRGDDRVAIVVYAGASGVALPSTPGDRKAEIQRAIADLRAGGSTNGAAGIQLAYQIAGQHFVKGGINRVLLATDGDFNVGVTSQGELLRLIERERERGIFLSVLGVGTGNLKDSTMEKLADTGNGNYSYLDSLHEARRVLIAEAGATLVTVAKDVKIQVEFNPRAAAAYRLIGYENRLLKKEDFNNDRKDAGEIGAGHTVTALYEVVPPGEPVEGTDVDPLKYQTVPAPTSASRSGELMTVKLRYKAPEGDQSKLLTVAAPDRTAPLTPNVGFAAAVAEFGLLLRGSEFKGDSSWSAVQALARQYRGDDPDGYRAEFIRLAELAAALEAQNATSPQSRR
jgi:Ca-activated chloride channel family protein